MDPDAADPAPWRLRSSRVLFDMVGDPRPGHRLLGVSDPDVHLVDGRWTMFLGAFTTRFVVRVVEARLPEGDAVDSDRWRLVARDGRAVELGAPTGQAAWDRAGMHTPCYVRGVAGGSQVERLYYAGRRTTAGTGPRSRYAIGVLERHDGAWRRREGPVIEGDAARPSALEPRVVHDGGRWRAWYLATTGEVGRGEQPDYEVRYAESDDGLAWRPAVTFSTAREGWFDAGVAPVGDGWGMVLARGTNLHGTRPFPTQGLWWSTASAPGPREAWSPVTRLLDTDHEPEPWYGAGCAVRRWCPTARRCTSSPRGRVRRRRGGARRRVACARGAAHRRRRRTSSRRVA